MDLQQKKIGEETREKKKENSFGRVKTYSFLLHFFLGKEKFCKTPFLSTGLTFFSLSFFLLSGFLFLSFFFLPQGFTQKAFSSVQNAEKTRAEKALAQIIKEHWDFEISQSPSLAGKNRKKEALSKLPDVSPRASQRKKEAYQKFFQALKAIDEQELSMESKLNRDLLLYVLETNLTLLSFDSERIPFVSDSGFQTYFLFSAEETSPVSVAEAEAYLERLKKAPRYFDQEQANMQRGLKTGFVAPAAVVRAVLETLKNLTPKKYVSKESLKEAPLLQPLNRLPDTVSGAEKQRLFSEGKTILEEIVRPAFQKISRFMEKKYLPHARKTLAARDFPNGEAYYKALVRYYTNLDLDPDTVYQIGLKEVKRIRARMEEVKQKAGYKGSLSDFIYFLRTDDQFYAKTKLELLKEAAWITKQTEGRLPAFFTVLPRLPLTVAPVPKEIEANYTTGRYVGGSFASRRSGTYWVNTYDLRKSPLYELAALSLHEGVPGHHLQGALSQELVGIPEFRRGMYPHAFGEGWGLYSEKLGEDFGIYKTPYEEFGRLSYEMWRACRLIADTGLHWKRWTRAQAKACFLENTALSDANIENELDRYISWPGQALAYKIGELKILELRKKAEDTLKDKFDIRAFHDALLAHGAVPLKILEKNFTYWLGQEVKKNAKPVSPVSKTGKR